MQETWKETGPFLGYGPQGLALEKNPWQTKDTLEKALLYRGCIVAAWANVETCLVDLAIRASHHQAYTKIRENFPTKLSARLTYLRAVLQEPGPLSRFRSLGEAILNRYEASAKDRNLMAHAGMTVLPNWGATFTSFQAKSPKQVESRTVRITLSELERQALRSARFSRAVIYLAGRVNEFTDLTPS